jgi:hypothetical protein
MIEPTRKQSLNDALQNSSGTSSSSSFCLENLKQHSSSLDQASSSLSANSTSTESLKYAEPPVVISTHVTNPLIEKELALAKAPAKLDLLDKSPVTNFSSFSIQLRHYC